MKAKPTPVPQSYPLPTPSLRMTPGSVSSVLSLLDPANLLPPSLIHRKKHRFGVRKTYALLLAERSWAGYFSLWASISPPVRQSQESPLGREAPESGNMMFRVERLQPCYLPLPYSSSGPWEMPSASPLLVGSQPHMAPTAYPLPHGFTQLVSDLGSELVPWEDRGWSRIIHQRTLVGYSPWGRRVRHWPPPPTEYWV